MLATGAKISRSFNLAEEDASRSIRAAHFGTNKKTHQTKSLIVLKQRLGRLRVQDFGWRALRLWRPHFTIPPPLFPIAWLGLQSGYIHPHADPPHVHLVANIQGLGFSVK